MRQERRPAGKALNVSRALAWLGVKSVGGGLWGADDYGALQREMRPLGRWISVAMTTVAGGTRENITVIDTARRRELHLRGESQLATRGALRRLRGQLSELVGPGDVVVLAGSTPAGPLRGEVPALVKSLRSGGVELVVDTSGPGLRDLVEAGGLGLIKPNVEEFRELLGKRIPDRAGALVKAAEALLERVGAVLISRAEKGAVLVGPEGAWQGCCRESRPVQTTVACGDYLLAGYLAAYGRGASAAEALKGAVQVATARAWGLSERVSWGEARKEIAVEVEALQGRLSPGDRGTGAGRENS